MGLERDTDPPLLQVQQVRDNFFVHKWGNGERLLLAACVGLSFSPIFAVKEK